MQLECVLKYSGFLTVGVHIKKGAAAQELQSGCVIVIITLNYILFSFVSHNYVLSASIFVLVVICVQLFSSRWMSSLWNTQLAKFCALGLWAMLCSFTKFLTNLRIWEGYSPYKDAHDSVYAECMFLIWQVHWKNESIGPHCFQFAHSPAVSVQQVLQQRWLYGSDLVVCTLLSSDLAGTSLCVPPSVVGSTEILTPMRKFVQITGTILLQLVVFAFSNLNFASKSIYIEMSNSCW